LLLDAEVLVQIFFCCKVKCAKRKIKKRLLLRNLIVHNVHPSCCIISKLK
jgi:hypothetical protein